MIVTFMFIYKQFILIFSNFTFHKETMLKLFFNYFLFFFKLFSLYIYKWKIICEMENIHDIFCI